jgi:ribosomal-protein-serine acetyltransferase
VDATRSVNDSKQFLELNYAGFLNNGGFNFGIHYEGYLVGVIGFHGFDRVNRVTSLGYWLTKEACGQGIMRQCAASCTNYAFKFQNMNRIYIRCAVGNERSKNIPKALGYTLEGTQRQAEWLYDHFVDLEVYSLLASEWDESLLG